MIRLSFSAENARNAARLLKSTDSGRMRSPPPVDKFRRAKEASTLANMRQPNDGRLGQLERMFRQVCSAPSRTLTPCNALPMQWSYVSPDAQTG